MSTMSAMTLRAKPAAIELSSHAGCLSGRRVVVTGGAGFIGSHLVDTLATAAARVVVLDDLSTGSLSNLSKVLRNFSVEFIRGSILDTHLLGTVISENDIIFHLAAIPSVARSMQDPLASDLVNTHGTLTVLKAAADARAARVVFASSSSVYGDLPTLPRVEEDTPLPMSPYAASKLAGERYCQVFASQFGLQTTVGRFFNVYGPRQNPDSPYSAVVPRFIDAALDGRALTIYGNGQQSRDFTYVSDVVGACIHLATHRETGVFNVAAGNTISINQLARQVIHLASSSSPMRHSLERPGDIRDSAADITRLRILGYQPQVTIEEGLRMTLEWTHLTA